MAQYFLRLYGQSWIEYAIALFALFTTVVCFSLQLNMHKNNKLFRSLVFTTYTSRYLTFFVFIPYSLRIYLLLFNAIYFKFIFYAGIFFLRHCYYNHCNYFTFLFMLLCATGFFVGYSCFLLHVFYLQTYTQRNAARKWNENKAKSNSTKMCLPDYYCHFFSLLYNFF